MALILDRATVRAEWRRLEALERGFTPTQAAHIGWLSWLVLQRGIHPDYDTRGAYADWVAKGCLAPEEQ